MSKLNSDIKFCKNLNPLFIVSCRATKYILSNLLVFKILFLEINDLGSDDFSASLALIHGS